MFQHVSPVTTVSTYLLDDTTGLPTSLIKTTLLESLPPKCFLHFEFNPEFYNHLKLSVTTW